MNRLAAQFPEYETVMAMNGAGPSVGPQLMAEIGDVRRLAQKSSLIAFAGIDPGRNDSGSKESNKGRIGKRGSPHLRKTLFLIKALGCEKYQLSLDGLRETHDWFRKPGSFDITLEKIQTIKKAGIKAVIMTTVSGTNIDKIPALIDTVVEHEADVFAFSRYCPTSGEKDVGIEPMRYRQLLADCDRKFKAYKAAGCRTAGWRTCSRTGLPMCGCVRWSATGSTHSLRSVQNVSCWPGAGAARQ